MLVISIILALLLNVHTDGISQEDQDIFGAVFVGAPYEVVMIYCYDGLLFVYTEEQEGGVYLRLSWLRDKLKKHGKDMDDIKIIIHNHLLNRPLCKHFSPGDRRQLQLLRNKGFKGLYALWVGDRITQVIEWRK